MIMSRKSQSCNVIWIEVCLIIPGHIEDIELPNALNYYQALGNFDFT